MLQDYIISEANTGFKAGILRFNEISLFYLFKNLRKCAFLVRKIRKIMYLFILFLGSSYFYFLTSVKIIQEKGDIFFDKYLKEYYDIPWFILPKVIEGRLFSKVNITHPSLEIGLEDGRISRLNFEGKKIDVGVEYVPSILKKAQKNEIFNNLLSADIYHLPFKDKSFSTILLVHTMDHLSYPEKALQEISRILKDDSTVIFSCWSEEFGKHTFYAMLLKMLGLKNKLDRYIESISRRHAIYNFFPCKEWQEIMDRFALKVIEHKYFLSTKLALLWSFVDFNLGYSAHMIFSRRAKNRNFIFKIIRNFYYPLYINDETMCRKNLGIGTYIVAKKIGNDKRKD